MGFEQRGFEKRGASSGECTGMECCEEFYRVKGTTSENIYSRWLS
jgi:hypothetical protein